MAELLKGIRVLENAANITGPLAAQILADLGADVIKVENPDGGDTFRKWDGAEDVVSMSFAGYNRGKKSITLNLRTEKGRDIYRELAKQADVLIENFRPGAMDARAIGYAALSKLNPRLVYCHITGMGPTGPFKDRPVFDGVAQAMSGLWSAFIDVSDPEPVGPAMADTLTGKDAAAAVLAGLVSRSLTGEGTLVSVAMISSAMNVISSAFAAYLKEGKLPTRNGRGRQSQTYAWVDSEGKPLAVHLSTPKKFWDALCRTVGHPEMADDERYSNKNKRIALYEEIHAKFAPIFATKDRETWLKAFEAEDVPAAPIQTVDEVINHPQVKHLELFWDDEVSGYTLLKAPFQHQGEYAVRRSTPPRLGNDTDEVLKDLGYDAGEIASLHSDKVV